jgi:hypothetical protein
VSGPFADLTEKDVQCAGCNDWIITEEDGMNKQCIFFYDHSPLMFCCEGCKNNYEFEQGEVSPDQDYNKLLTGVKHKYLDDVPKFKLLIDNMKVLCKSQNKYVSIK